MCLVVALQNSEGASRDHFGPPAQLQVRSSSLLDTLLLTDSEMHGNLFTRVKELVNQFAHFCGCFQLSIKSGPKNQRLQKR